MRAAAIDREMQDDVVVRAEPFVLMIGRNETKVKLLVQRYDVVCLRDRSKTTTDIAGLARSWLKRQSRGSDPGALPCGVLCNQPLLHDTHPCRQHGAPRRIRNLPGSRDPVLE